METGPTGNVESLTLRFVGEEDDGTVLHELRAAHVAQVLEGLVGLTSDFAKAGAFGDGPAGSELLVRPAQDGSFLIEVVRIVHDHWGAISAGGSSTGIPTVGAILWWATRSARADVKDFSYLDNGNVKVSWQDNTVQEIPRAAWDELQKRERRRKKQLRQIMAPLSDDRVSSLEVQSPPEAEAGPAEQVKSFTLTKPDYDAVRPDDEEITEEQDIFEIEAQMSAIDFDNPKRWRVKTKGATRAATVEDQDFLGRVARGLAIRQTDIFRLRVRQDTVVKNGRARRTWTVLRVESFRRAAHDDDDAQSSSPGRS
ncbi:MAG: hypothetical protein JWO98_2235 [Frankiales bacterium]|nr:hypothetical protein [Frankiales bacterium]